MISILFEQALNHLLEMDTDIDIAPLNAKIIAIDIVDTPIRWLVAVSGRKVSILSAAYTSPAYDLDMVIYKPALLRLIKKEPLKDLLNSDDIEMIGDVKVAQALADLLTALDFDYEEILAYYSNDIFARSVGLSVSFIKQNPPPEPLVNFAKASLRKIGQFLQ